jgi:UDP-3-O-acyl N-acetylglucosamine deacetylase
MEKGRILIVDDEPSSVKALVGFLHDEGFTVSCARDGNRALSLIHTDMPDIVLLDIWLPGMDGFETLHALKSMSVDTEVIMMSGHGNIETAVRAIKLGAFDYIEKPLARDRLIPTIRRALNHRERSCHKGDFAFAPALTHRRQGQTVQHLDTSERLVRRKAAAPHMTYLPVHSARQLKQRTLRRTMVLHGQGLQSGLKTGMILSPLPPHSGIIFSNIATGETLPASIDFVESTDFSTSLRKGRVFARTVEHLMSVLHAYRITNLLIKISNEVPIMDGSAADFCQLIENGRIEEQEAIAEEFVVDRCYHIGTVNPDVKSLFVEPYDGFRITYRLNYPQPLGIQEITYEHRDSASYRYEIAPARTFGFVKDVEKMHEVGLLAGGRLNNVILLDDEKIVNNIQLRFPDECARHKVLDLIGDLYLLGKPLRGHVHANMTGHTENATLVTKLRNAMLRCR